MVEIKNLSSSKVEVVLEIPKEKWEEMLNAEYKKIGKQVVIKGFRKGKAPLNILKMYIPRDYVLNAVKDSLEEEVLSSLESEGYRVLAVRKLDFEENDEGIKVVAEADVYPKVEIPEGVLESLPIRKAEDALHVSEEEVEEVMRSALEEKFGIEESADKETLEDGDIAVVEWKMKVAGKETPPREAVFVLGEGDFIEEVEPHLRGMKRGEVRYILVDNETGEVKQVSEDTSAPEDGYVMIVELKDIRTRKLELNDELAKKLGFESLEELKKAFRERLEADKWTEWRNEVLDKLAEVIPVDVPDTLVLYEGSQRFKALKEDAKARKIDWDTYVASLGFESEDALIEHLQNISRSSVRDFLILEALANKFGVEVGSEDWEKKVLIKLSELVNGNGGGEA